MRPRLARRVWVLAALLPAANAIPVRSSAGSAGTSPEPGCLAPLPPIPTARREKEAHNRAVVLEMIGDLPEADAAPPPNMLFICKLNPVRGLVPAGCGWGLGAGLEPGAQRAARRAVARLAPAGRELALLLAWRL